MRADGGGAVRARLQLLGGMASLGDPWDRARTGTSFDDGSRHPARPPTANSGMDDDRVVHRDVRAGTGFREPSGESGAAEAGVVRRALRSAGGSPPAWRDKGDRVSGSLTENPGLGEKTSQPGTGRGAPARPSWDQ